MNISSSSVVLDISRFRDSQCPRSAPLRAHIAIHSVSSFEHTVRLHLCLGTFATAYTQAPSFILLQVPTFFLWL